MERGKRIKEEKIKIKREREQMLQRENICKLMVETLQFRALRTGQSTTRVSFL